MKLLSVAVLFGLLFLPSILTAQSGPRTPPGLRQAAQAEEQMEKNLSPPIQQRPLVDLAKLEQEADELAKIAQTIPPDVASVQKGMLPKDMIEKLKQIEKLSKRLRSRINQ